MAQPRSVLPPFESNLGRPWRCDARTAPGPSIEKSLIDGTRRVNEVVTIYRKLRTPSRCAAGAGFVAVLHITLCYIATCLSHAGLVPSTAYTPRRITPPYQKATRVMSPEASATRSRAPSPAREGRTLPGRVPSGVDPAPRPIFRVSAYGVRSRTWERRAFRSR
jgi:hypothetical protein